MCISSLSLVMIANRLFCLNVSKGTVIISFLFLDLNWLLLYIHVSTFPLHFMAAQWNKTYPFSGVYCSCLINSSIEISSLFFFFFCSLTLPRPPKDIEDLLMGKVISLWIICISSTLLNFVYLISVHCRLLLWQSRILHVMNSIIFVCSIL